MHVTRRMEYVKYIAGRHVAIPIWIKTMEKLSEFANRF